MILSTHDRPYGGFHCMNMRRHGISVQLFVFGEQQCEFSYLPFLFASLRTYLPMTENWSYFYLERPLRHAVQIRYNPHMIPYLDVSKLYFLEDIKMFTEHLHELIRLAQMLGAVLAYHKKLKEGDSE